jgi:putative membrane protein
VALGATGLVLLAAAGRATPGLAADAERRADRRAAATALALLPDSTDLAPPELVNDEVVVATLDPTGLPIRAALVSRVTATGEAREVTDPASLTNVRYLDRLGRPGTSPDGVLLTVGGDRPSALTQARFDKPLPVALHVEYALDGQVVPAADVPGASATVTATYTVTNTDAEQQELEFDDAGGEPQSSTRPVFAPFQGTLTATIPAGVQVLDPGGAALATDAEGRTLARWLVSLYPPISGPIQRMSIVTRAERAVVPAVEVVLTAVASEQDPADEFAADLLSGATEGNAELYEGLSALDAAAGQLAQGSGQLADGLSGLAAGTGQAVSASGVLADGVDALAAGADRAADASSELSDGVGALAAGARGVADGTGELADALGRAAGGAADLATATRALAAGTSGSPAGQLAPLVDGGAQIEAGLLAAAARIGGPSDPVLDITTPLPPDQDSTCPAGGTAPPDDDCATIYQGVRALRDGLRAVDAVVDALRPKVEAARAAGAQLLAALASIGQDAQTAAQGAADLVAALCDTSPPTLDDASCATLRTVADAAASAAGTAGGAAPALKDLVAAILALDAQARALAAALDNALAATERLLLGVEAVGLAVGTGTPAQPGLATAMAALNAGLRQLSDQLVASQAQLNTALRSVAAGSAELATGIDGAATGADALADGSTQLADGAGRAADGADALAEGSAQLADGAQGAATGADQLTDGLSGLAAGSQGAAAAGRDVADGATALEQEGTAPAAAGVLSASTTPAEAQAWLAAASARAADALPYGPPAGAVGHVAYVFALPEVSAPRSLWDRIRAVFGG